VAEQPKRGVLLGLAAEGVVPVLGGCAGALAGGPEGGVVGVAVGQAVEKVINFFGARIVQRWGEWFRAQPPEAREQALAELAELAPEEARRQAESLLDQFALEPIDAADRELALDYLSLLPGALDRALPRGPGGVRSLPPTVSLDEPAQLLSLLPVSLPPYPAGSEVPGTPYRLERLLGSGGFGAVYRASTRSLQHLPLAIKFCLDPALVLALHRERANLERLMKAGGENWSPRVVRLYGYDLEHQTPYLVYEYVTGGDLLRHLAEEREKKGRALDAQEVFGLIVQVTEGLAFAHEHGLVHRDLKPANVLVEGGLLKLADFGLGGVTAGRATQVSRIGATTVDQLSVADQASLFRGAGTPLYMAPEQRRGQPPDPRHDLYSLGVMWYQLLVGDVSRELHPGWAKELALRFGAPRAHLDLIERCVGWFDERPRHAGELLALLREEPAEPVQAPVPAPGTPAPKAARAPDTMRAPPTPEEAAQPADGMRESLLHALVKQLDEQHQEFTEQGHKLWSFLPLAGGVAIVGFLIALAVSHSAWFSLLATLVLGGAVAGVGYLVRLGRRAEARERLARTIRTLTDEFPEVVRDWGSENALRNPDVVRQIAQNIDRGKKPVRAPSRRTPDVVRQIAQDLGPAPVPPARPATPAEPVEIPALEPGARKGLVGKLRQLLEKQTAARRFAARKPFPFPLALLLGLAVGVATGGNLGALYGAYRLPGTDYGRERTDYGFEREYYSAAGEKVSYADYLREERFALAGAVAFGVVSGLLVCGLVTFLLARRPWYRGPMFGGLALGALLGAPFGGGVGSLYGALAMPIRVVEAAAPERRGTASAKKEKGNGAKAMPIWVEKERERVQYFSASGQELNWARYQLEEKHALATASLLGGSSGLSVLLGMMLLHQRWYHRRAGEAGRQVAEQLQQLNEAFPEVVAGQGGVGALRDRASVETLLRGLEGAGREGPPRE
jgi:serine/threonine protein kinase